MEIDQLLGAIRRRWVTGLVTGLLVATAVVIYTVLQEPAYRAATRIVATPVTGSDRNSPREAIAYAQAQARSFPGVVTSNDVLVPVIRELNLSARPRSLARQIDATVPVDALWMDIEVTDPSADTAAAISRSVATHFIERLNTLNGSSSAAQNLRLSVISQAEAPTSPAVPNWRLALAAATLLGATLALTSIALHELLDQRLRDARNTQRVISRPTFEANLEDLSLPNGNFTRAATAISVILRQALPAGGHVLVGSLIQGDIDVDPVVGAIASEIDGILGRLASGTPDTVGLEPKIAVLAVGPLFRSIGAYEAAGDADCAVVIVSPQTERGKVRDTEQLLSTLGAPLTALLMCNESKKTKRRR